jgi:Caspase domain
MRFLLLPLALTLLAGLHSPADVWASEPVYPGRDGYKLAPRTALVIGVSSVAPGTGFFPLTNPVNDAMLVTKALRDLRFSVFAPNESYKPEQMTRQTIKRALYDFALTLKATGGVGLIYYSGHGIQRNDQMYVVPYDVYVRYDRDLSEEMIPIQLFYEAFKYAGNKLNFLIVDACRNNPWDKSLEAFGDVAPANSAQELESVIRSNSTLSGTKASDGEGKLSPYASSFVDGLQSADVDVARFNIDVAELVRDRTEKGQTPIVSSPGAHDFVFRPTIVSFNKEEQIYLTAKSTGSRKLYEKLTTTYAGGYFNRAAQEILDHGDLAHAADTQSVVLTKAAVTSVYSAASIQSYVVGTKARGDVLRVVESSERASTDKWIPVVVQGRIDPGFVERAAVRAEVLDVTAYDMEFVAGRLAGTEALSTAAAAKVAEVAKAANLAFVSRVEVVSYREGTEGEGDVAQQQLVLRQAAVLQSLKEAGLDASKVILTSKESGVQSLLGSVQVVLSTINRASPKR